MDVKGPKTEGRRHNNTDNRMNKEKNPYIKDIEDGQFVEGQFLVKEMSRAETRNNKPYLMLSIMDNSGEIDCRLWDNADQLINECRPGNIIALTGQAQAYKGTLQIKIDTLRAMDRSSVDMGRFMPAAPENIQQMVLETGALAESVQNPKLRKLLTNFFKNNGFLERFQQAPAAKNMHHAYIGGLLEHTLSVTRLADMLAGFYKTLDRDLMIAGALLHDIGKMEEFDYSSYPFNYTDQGRLVGHLVIGVEMLRDNIRTIKDFPEELATRLQHLILSHHGQHEYGSPALPMMAEAFVLNFIDDMDAKVQYLKQAGERLPGDDYQWTDYQRMFERFLYVKGREPGEAEQIKADPPEDSPQQKLF